jgi:hypothetical protein
LSCLAGNKSTVVRILGVLALVGMPLLFVLNPRPSRKPVFSSQILKARVCRSVAVVGFENS